MNKFLTVLLFFAVTFNSYGQSGVLGGTIEKDGTTLTTTIATATTTSTSAINMNTPEINITNPAAASTSLMIYSSNTNYAAGMTLRGLGTSYGSVSVASMRNTLASPQAILAGKEIGRFNFKATYTTNTNLTSSTYISSTAFDNFSSTAQGTDIKFVLPERGTSTGVTKLTILDNGGIIYAPRNTGDITAGTGITAVMCSMDMRYNGSGAVDITAVPQIAAGTDGQIISITGLSDVNTLTIDNGNGIVCPAQRVLGLNDIWSAKYISTSSAWVEFDFTNN